VFTPEERARLRDSLVSAAHADERITGAALTGSAASGTEDRWSDIDLALGLAADADLSQVIADWTDLMYTEHGAIHHMDVAPRRAVYRVFLLASTLQVDLAFAPAADFGPIAPTFRLIFGTAAEQAPVPAPGAAELIGLGWLYALHARSSIARGRGWQAEYMISGVRDHVLALACLRHGVPAVQGRGMDSLPPVATTAITGALVRSLDVSELARAFRVATEALLAETRQVDSGLADGLASTLRELAGQGACPVSPDVT
jgi:predicted nucleotidyltransferase